MGCKIGMGLLVLVYLLTMARFAFQPFQWIPGKHYTATPLERSDGAVHLFPGLALESSGDVRRMRTALMTSNRMSLEVVLKTDDLNQGGPARIISFSRNMMIRNFTLGQEGKALVFRLRTTATDLNGVLSELRIPHVFAPSRIQHVVVVYDGEKVRLYLDGQLHPSAIQLAGGFENWGKNHALVFGDEVPGGRPWSGHLQRATIFDRALGIDEVAALYEGRAVGFPVLAEEFTAEHRLRYRRLFITHDPAAYSWIDLVSNIMGFIPLAGLLWLIFPARLRKRKKLAVWGIPIALGFSASAGIELTQRYLDMRVPCTLDLIYNLVGTLLGCGLLWALLDGFRKSRDQGRRGLFPPTE